MKFWYIITVLSYLPRLLSIAIYIATYIANEQLLKEIEDIIIFYNFYETNWDVKLQ